MTNNESKREESRHPTMMTSEQLAQYLGVTERFLAQRRKEGKPPRYVILSSRCLRYRWADVQEWIESVKV